MDENKTNAQAELDAKAAAAQAEESRKIAHARAMELADLGIKESTASYNKAKKWGAWGIGAGVALAGLGALISALKQ